MWYNFGAARPTRRLRKKEKARGLSPEPLATYAVSLCHYGIDTAMSEYPFAFWISPLTGGAVDYPHTTLEVVARATSDYLASSKIVSYVFFHFDYLSFTFCNYYNTLKWICQ
jgi:hypothetical protein